jgi:hypothetical protein
MSLSSGAGTQSSSWGDDTFNGGSIATRPAELPAPSEEGPDADGIKTTTTYRRTEKGAVEKIVRRVRVITQQIRVPEGARLRAANGIPKFGRAKESNEGMTYPSTDDLRIEKPGSVAEKSQLETIVSQGVSGWAIMVAS